MGAIGSGELREAVAEGPILLRGLENIHEHVLRADAWAFAEQLRGPAERRSALKVLGDMLSYTVPTPSTGGAPNDVVWKRVK